IFGLHGVALPRDAWQQGGAGTALDGGQTALQPGDLLFFSERDDRRMTHVAISAGGAEIVHLAVARGGYAAESLESDDPVSAALKSRFLFGRRVLPAE
ncbi:MAG: NlpC/P60 family protein, partial [Gemmatimonadaceae bacterium]